MVIKVKGDDDSDETAGRVLYRARADALARSQVAMGKRRFKLVKDVTVKDMTVFVVGGEWGNIDD